jgi:hypothetical protein
MRLSSEFKAAVVPSRARLRPRSKCGTLKGEITGAIGLTSATISKGDSRSGAESTSEQRPFWNRER